MASIKHLVDIDLNKNQLTNVSLQHLAGNPSGTGEDFEGRIFYDSSSGVKAVKFHNGTSFITLSTSTATGDITGVTLAGDSGTADDGTANVNLTIAGGNGITTSASGTTLTAALDASLTTVTSMLNTSLVVGRDADNQIKFGTDNNIIFRVGAGDGVTFKASGEIEATSLDISGDADIDGTLEADAITIGGTSLADTITGTTVTNSTNSAHVLITDNENTDEENQITFIEGAGGGGANRGLEADGDFTYNPSTGTVTATVFKGNIDAVNGDFDGTLEADAITIGGTALNTVIAGVTVANATTAAVATTVTISDNENTNEENALVFTSAGDIDGGNLGLEADGNATYNPSTGTITATIFKGNIDAVDGDFDGTLETDALTIGGTNLLSGAMEFSGNTVFSGNPSFSGTPSVSGTLSVAANIVHTGDTNTLIGFTTDAIKMQTGGTARIDVSDSGVRFGGTGARITQVEDNDSLGTSDTKLATQGNVKAYVDARTGTNITSLGTIAQDTILFQSSAGDDPLLTLENTANDSTGARIQLLKDRGAAPGDGDELGEIIFSGDDSGQNQTNYVKLRGLTADVTDGAEGGKFEIRVATHDGEMQPGLIIQDGNAEDEIDVTIGSGSGSVTTINGDLTVSGTTTTVNSTTVNLNDHNIVLDSGNSTSAVVNGAGITIEGGSGDDAKINYSTTGPKFELLLGSSYEDLQVAQLIASSLDISGNVDVDGTLETDALTVNGTAIATLIANTTVTTATNANHVAITDNESTDEENQITFIENASGGTANRGLEADGDFTYNPSSGTVTATVFKGNIDAVDGDFDGTLETDALSIGGTTITTTAAEINLIDGNTSRGTTAVANGDGFLHNDGGTMRMTNVSKLADLFAGTNISASNSVLSVADADASTKGVAERALTSEALAGTDNTRFVTPAGLAARSFAITIGDDSATQFTVNHQLGTRDVVVQLYDASSYETLVAQVVRTDSDNVTVTFNTAPGESDVRVLVTKVD